MPAGRHQLVPGLSRSAELAERLLELRRRSPSASATASEEFDELVEQGDTTVDPEERLQLYEQAGQILVDDVPAPFLYNAANVFLVKPDVTGYTGTAADSEIPGQCGSLMTDRQGGNSFAAERARRLPGPSSFAKRLGVSMLEFFARRVLWIIPVVLTVAAVTFFLMHRAPGGPWDQEKAARRPRRSAALNAKFGLDKPLWVNPTRRATSGTSGERNPLHARPRRSSIASSSTICSALPARPRPVVRLEGRRNVAEGDRRKVPGIRLKIGLVAIVFAVLVGFRSGSSARLRQNTWVDYLSLFTSTHRHLGADLRHRGAADHLHEPELRRLADPPTEEWDGFGPAYILPGIVLGLGTMAYVTRLTRASMLEIKRQDYIRTARAKGLRETPV